MNIGKILSGGVGTLIGTISDVADKFITTGDEKNEFKLKIQEAITKRDSEIEQTIRTELQAKERIITAEMNQGDNYTKRARPTLVYVGLVMIMINYVIVPFINQILGYGAEPFELPAEFWATWGGVCGLWVVGRSVEKRGVPNMVAGSKKASLFED